MQRRIVPVLVALSACLFVIIPAFATTTVYLPLTTTGRVPSAPSASPPLVPSPSSIPATPDTTTTPLPTPTLSATATIIPTATPNVVASLVITHTSISSYSNGKSTGSGMYQVVIGEVVNTGTAAAYDVNITGTFYDATNTVVGTATGLALLTEIRGGNDTVPFYILFNDAPPTIARYEVTISSAHADTLRTYYRLPVVSQGTRPNTNNGMDVYGKVRNDQSIGLFVHVAATFYDANGTVVEVAADTTIPANLDAGATADYLFAFNRSFTWARYRVQSEAY